MCRPRIGVAVDLLSSPKPAGGRRRRRRGWCCRGGKEKGKKREKKKRSDDLRNIYSLTTYQKGHFIHRMDGLPSRFFFSFSAVKTDDPIRRTFTPKSQLAGVLEPRLFCCLTIETHKAGPLSTISQASDLRPGNCGVVVKLFCMILRKEYIAQEDWANTDIDDPSRLHLYLV